MRPSTCTQAHHHHVIVANNTTLITSTHVTARPPARIRGNKQIPYFLHVRLPAHTHVRPQKLWADYKHYGSLCGCEC
jgi:hypothetical protein